MISVYSFAGFGEFWKPIEGLYIAFRTNLGCSHFWQFFELVLEVDSYIQRQVTSNTSKSQIIEYGNSLNFSKNYSTVSNLDSQTQNLI